MNMSVSHCKLDIVCGLCSDVLKDPQQTTCCGSHFCRNCIDGKFSTGENECPQCNAREVSYFNDIHFGRLVYACTQKECSRTCDLESHPSEHCPKNKHGEERVPRVNDITITSSASNDRETCTYEEECCNSICQYCGCQDEFKVITGKHLLECEKYPIECPNHCDTGVVERGQMEAHINLHCSLQPMKCKFKDVGCTAHLPREQMHSHMREASDEHLLLVFTRLTTKLSSVHSDFERQCKEITKRQEKVEQMLDTQQNFLQTLCSKVEAMESRVCSHTLLPFKVTVPSIDHYIEGSVGDEWKSPEFYTGTYSNKGYKLQLSIVPHSLHMRNKEKALSARLLITNGEQDGDLTWPFHARFNLVFIDPSGTEIPYKVFGRHTWESPGDESSMQFKACITHQDLLKYVKLDNHLHVYVQDHDHKCT